MIEVDGLTEKENKRQKNQLQASKAVKELMNKHKRLLEDTSLGAWDIYYSLEKHLKDENVCQMCKTTLTECPRCGVVYCTKCLLVANLPAGSPELKKP